MSNPAVAAVAKPEFTEKNPPRGRAAIGAVFDVYRPDGTGGRQKLRTVQVVDAQGAVFKLRTIERYVSASFYPTVVAATLADRRAYVYLRHEPIPAGWAAKPVEAPKPEAAEGEGAASSKQPSERMFSTLPIIDDVRVGDIVEVAPTSTSIKDGLAIVRVVKVDSASVHFEVIDRDSGVRIAPSVLRGSFRQGRYTIRERDPQAPLAPGRITSRKALAEIAAAEAATPTPAPAPAPADGAALIEQLKGIIAKQLPTADVLKELDALAAIAVELETRSRQLHADAETLQQAVTRIIDLLPRS